MRPTTAQQLRAVAPQILSGQYTLNTPFCPDVAKRAIAILNHLKDNQWHSSTEIAEAIGIGHRYASDILRLCSEAWELESKRSVGYRLPLNVCPDCKAIYYPDTHSDHVYHECDACGWSKVENLEN